MLDSRYLCLKPKRRDRDREWTWHHFHHARRDLHHGFASFLGRHIKELQDSCSLQIAFTQVSTSSSLSSMLYGGFDFMAKAREIHRWTVNWERSECPSATLLLTSSIFSINRCGRSIPFFDRNLLHWGPQPLRCAGCLLTSCNTLMMFTIVSYKVKIFSNKFDIVRISIYNYLGCSLTRLRKIRITVSFQSMLSINLQGVFQKRKCILHSCIFCRHATEISHDYVGIIWNMFSKISMYQYIRQAKCFSLS